MRKCRQMHRKCINISQNMSFFSVDGNYVEGKVYVIDE